MHSGMGTIMIDHINTKATKYRGKNPRVDKKGNVSYEVIHDSGSR